MESFAHRKKLVVASAYYYARKLYSRKNAVLIQSMFHDNDRTGRHTLSFAENALKTAERPGNAFPKNDEVSSMLYRDVSVAR